MTDRSVPVPVPVSLAMALAMALALAWGCGSPSEPPRPDPGPGGLKPPAGEPAPAQPVAGDADDLGLKPAETPVKGAAGPYPAKAAEEVRGGFARIGRLPEHVVKALVKTPRDLKAKGLLAEAEKPKVTSQVTIALAMNGWVSPDGWRDSRARAGSALAALAALQKIESDPARADKAELVAKAQAALAAAEATEEDLKTVHKYQQDLAEALALKP